MIQTLASNVELHSHFYLTLQQPDPLLSRRRGSRVLHKVSTLAHFLGMIFEAFFVLRRLFAGIKIPANPEIAKNQKGTTWIN